MIYQEQPNEKRLFDITTTVIYIGNADRQMTSAQKAWTIQKIDLDSFGNPTTLSTTTPYSGVWDNRASEAYT